MFLPHNSPKTHLKNIDNIDLLSYLHCKSQHMYNGSNWTRSYLVLIRWLIGLAVNSSDQCMLWFNIKPLLTGTLAGPTNKYYCYTIG